MDKLIGEFNRSAQKVWHILFELALQEGCKPRRRERICPDKEFDLPNQPYISPLITATALLQLSPWSAIPFVLMNGCQEFRSFIYQFHTLFQDSDSYRAPTPSFYWPFQRDCPYRKEKRQLVERLLRRWPSLRQE